MYLLLLNYYKSNNIYKNRNSNRSTVSRPMDTNYGKQKKEINNFPLDFIMATRKQFIR